ncbi:MAG TPA: methyl-accepting chemotaxis protein [Aquabacterium sp.]|uniref:methyl-accepting chemotaxis protein n=1 Tax=Aquabacterium sp. TaxID=1872578 RepID=UPI002E308DE5|nr:methyl-accepting chemotaxis protein [Aquabacterium sp.]HEX5354604.1 methyl-accepting chemotaxis protein [Aquabacterium sp.]
MRASNSPSYIFDYNDRIVLAAIAAEFLGVLIYGGQYGNLALGALLGAALMGASLVVAAVSKGALLSRVGLPFLGMAMEALMIHVARGHIEAHFGVFAFLACLVVYRSALPILVGAGTIAVHHLSFNQLQAWGWGPMCFPEPGFMRVIEHAVFVVVESAVLLFLAARARAEFSAAGELMSIAERLQADDGSVDLSVAKMDASGSAGRKLVEALKHVSASIQQVRTVVSGIHQACGEITDGNQALRARTEDAAAHIAETTSSVDQIAAIIRASVTHAHEANNLVGSASSVAQQGGEAVHRVVETMSGIQQSSRKITDIIGVIDGIAFQTNILALNAAVEAARAGEQGRGFAVVAAEVRSLAQRSAEAAKEIKQLITSSVEQVDSGSGLVDNTGRIISDVVDQVRRVSQLVEQITVSSSEQGEGIGQINQVISRLDESTQQNASLVDRTADAAARLRRQADELMMAMSVFKTA